MAFLMRITLSGIFSTALLSGIVSCANKGTPSKVVTDGVVVSVRDQKLAVMRNGEPVKVYKVSTSKFGLGDKKGSYKTPVGEHSIAAKIGDNIPSGTVFKSRKPTREVVGPDSPGRDPIVSRIIWLKGHELHNKNAYSRLIYIHGTTEESLIGKPASYGCIRMKSEDICELFPHLSKGEAVVVETCSLKASINAANNFMRQQNETTVMPGITYIGGGSDVMLNGEETPAHYLSSPKNKPSSHLLNRSAKKTRRHG